MTKTSEARAIITASYILYLIDGILDKSEHSNMTTIRLKQKLLSKTVKAQNKAYVKMSKHAWDIVVDKYKDKNYRLAIFDAVESLSFAEADNLIAMFGDNILQLTSAFSLKQTRDGVESKILKESREICKALKEALGKVVFDNKDELK